VVDDAALAAGTDGTSPEGLLDAPSPIARRRMTAGQRREQLLDVGRALFAERGFDATTMEEIAAKAQVSKPVVYEHFGTKEGLYGVVVDREVLDLLSRITESLSGEGSARVFLERAALALLDYIESSSDGFRILVRDSPVSHATGSFSSLLGDVATQVEHLLVGAFARHGFDPHAAPMYAQMLVGMIAMTGQWWLDSREPAKANVAAHLVNLAWNGLSSLDPAPRLIARTALG